MTTIIISLIAIATLFLLALIIYSVYKKNNEQKKATLLTRFSHLGTEYNLAFTCQEILGRRIIGLDGIKKTLVILEERRKAMNWRILHLNDVHACKVEFIYQKANAFALKKKTMEEYVEKVLLVFDRKHNLPPVELPFYVFNEQHIVQLGEMSRKASHWQNIISKMLLTGLSKTA